MNFTAKARKAVASVLAVSTIMWAAALTVAPVSAAPHNEGCLVNVNGTVYLLSGGQKRGFTSAEVFMSHGYHFGQVVIANSDDVSLPTGAILIYADGTLVKGPNDPLVYLVVNGQKRGFTSGSVFTGLGYSFANIQWAPVNTFQDIPTGSNIDSTTETGLPLSGPGPRTVVCTTTGTPPPGDLQGTVGDVTLTLTSTYSGENVGEGDDEVGVLSWDVEAGNSSDVRVTSVKIELQQTVTTNSEDITDYLTEVQVFMDGVEVGSKDTDEFTETSDRYSATIVLNNAVVRADQTEEFSVHVSALNNIDSADIDDDAWDVELDTLRFVDGDGVTTTETPAPNAIDEAFDVDTFAGANDVELTVNLNEDDEDINESHIVDVDDSSDTNGVSVLSFTLEAEGSDITVTEIPVLLSTTEAAGTHFDDPNDIVKKAYLYHGSTLLDSLTVNADSATTDATTITFDNFSVSIDEDDEEEFMVKIDLIGTDGVLDDGDQVKAEITSALADLIEAEDSSGEDLSTTDLTGTALGEFIALYDNGIMVDFVSSSVTRSSVADAVNESDTGEFKITFEVTAFGDNDMRVDKSCETDNGSNAAGQGVVFDETLGTATNTTGWSISCILSSSSTDSEDNTNVFEVDRNTTRTFTLTTNITPDEDAFVEIVLESVNWGTATDNTNANYYSFNLDDFKTDSIFLNDM